MNHFFLFTFLKLICFLPELLYILFLPFFVRFFLVVRLCVCLIHPSAFTSHSFSLSLFCQSLFSFCDLSHILTAQSSIFSLIHFLFIFNLSFFFLSMTQLLSSIVCFYCIQRYFCLFSITYWNFQREGIHIDGSVLNRMMSATQLLKAHFIPLTCQQLEATEQIGLLYL